MKEDLNFTSFYLATLFGEKKVYWNSKDNKAYHKITLEVIKQVGGHLGINSHRLTRGKNKGKLMLKLQSFDYTKELIERKVIWKATGRKCYNQFLGKETSHISKVYPLAINRAWIDFGKGSNDAGYLIFNTDLTYEGIASVKIFIAPNTKNDTGFRQMFTNGDFDEELRLLEAKADEDGQIPLDL